MCEIGPGDVVHFRRKELHWHGAAPNCFMTHVAITPRSIFRRDRCKQRVTDEQYGQRVVSGNTAREAVNFSCTTCQTRLTTFWWGPAERPRLALAKSGASTISPWKRCR